LGICLRYRDNYYSKLLNSFGFELEFEGYKAIACNAGAVSSQLFDSVANKYDLLIPFVFDGKKWTVSLYTKRNHIDVAELAKKYGGGGHKQAAGFVCEKLPF
jgi:oligoribonuclease NrnB/cAMP/cGMP phosphodiesterase (DHH superfamily)